MIHELVYKIGPLLAGVAFAMMFWIEEYPLLESLTQATITGALAGFAGVLIQSVKEALKNGCDKVSGETYRMLSFATLFGAAAALCEFFSGERTLLTIGLFGGALIICVVCFASSFSTEEKEPEK